MRSGSDATSLTSRIGSLDSVRAALSQVTRARPQSASAQLADYYELLSNTLIDLYELDPATAFDRIEGSWPRIRPLLRVQSVATEALFARGCAATASAPSQPPAYNVARRCARKLWGLGTGYSRMQSLQVQATIAAPRGDRERAIRLLRAVIAACDELDTRGQQAAARMRLAMLDDNPVAQAAAAEAEGALRVQGVVSPRRFANMFTPGLVEK